MENIIELGEKVEIVRKKLNEAISIESNLTSENILRISRELDKLLLEYQEKMNKK